MFSLSLSLINSLPHFNFLYFLTKALKPSPTRKRPTIKNNNLNKTTDDQIIQNNNKNKQNRSFTTTSSTIPTIVNFNKNKKQYQIPDDAQAALDNYNDEETEDEDERDSGININVNTLEKNINKRLDRLSSTPLQQQQQQQLQSVTKIVRKYNNDDDDNETNKLSSTNMKLINSVNSSYNEIRTSINNNNDNKFKGKLLINYFYGEGTHAQQQQHLISILYPSNLCVMFLIKKKKPFLPSQGHFFI
jgi:type III secretory pathway component EscV